MMTTARPRRTDALRPPARHAAGHHLPLPSFAIVAGVLLGLFGWGFGPDFEIDGSFRFPFRLAVRLARQGTAAFAAPDRGQLRLLRPAGAPPTVASAPDPHDAGSAPLPPWMAARNASFAQCNGSARPPLGAGPVFRPHRFVLIGGLAGRSLHGPLEAATPGPAWGAIDLVAKLRQQRPHVPTAVIGIGENTDHRTPTGWMLQGAAEQALLRELDAAAWVVGPGELSCYTDPHHPPPGLADGILSNLRTAGGLVQFRPFRLIACGELHVLVVGLIDPDLATDLPVSGFDAAAWEDPLRAWHRVKQTAPPADLTLCVAHLTGPNLRRLAREIGPTDRLITLGPPPTRIDEQAGRWSIAPAHDRLPAIETWPRGHHRPEILRRKHDLPLRSPPRPAPAGFATVAGRLQAVAGEPLAIIGSDRIAAPMPDTVGFHPDAHAAMARALCRADLAITSAGDELGSTERVLTRGQLAARVPPHRLRTWRLRGIAIENLLRAIAGPGQPPRLGLSGGRVRFLGAVLRDITIGNEPLVPERSYCVTLDETVFADRRLANRLPDHRLERRRGLTLWDAWLTGLRRREGLEPFMERERSSRF